jgi:hypothetical protein
LRRGPQNRSPAGLYSALGSRPVSASSRSSNGPPSGTATASFAYDVERLDCVALDWSFDAFSSLHAEAVLFVRPSLGGVQASVVGALSEQLVMAAPFHDLARL